MKYILIVLLLAGCGGGGSSDTEPTIETPVIESVEVVEPEKVEEVVEAIEEVILEPIYLVTGQSNARIPDWEYFKGLTGFNTVNIAKSGQGIDYLVDHFNPDNATKYDLQDIIFIHGERDSYDFTDPDYYIARVEEYRQLISIAAGKDLKLLISTVGHPSIDELRDSTHFPIIREAVRSEALINDNWVIVFDDAEQYEVWGMLKDHIHANDAAQILLMDTFAAYVNK